MCRVIKTKFGTAIINSHGYYQICSRKEKNYGKYWHRLIFEDFYGFEIPKGFHIHHKNGNPLDCCILNLQIISASEHKSLHNKGNNYMLGKHHSEETKKIISEAQKGNKHMLGKKLSIESKIKISKYRNTSGYYRVFKKKDSHCKQGFRWVYSYYENGKYKRITNVDINKLEEKVKAKGLEWIKFDDEVLENC